MNVTVILCSEKQRVFETVGLSANRVAEFQDHPVGNEYDHIQKLYQFCGYSLVPDKTTDIADFAVLIRRSVTNFNLRRSL
jgi:hypothetical protein